MDADYDQCDDSDEDPVESRQRKFLQDEFDADIDTQNDVIDKLRGRHTFNQNAYDYIQGYNGKNGRQLKGKFVGIPLADGIRNYLVQ